VPFKASFAAPQHYANRAWLKPVAVTLPHSPAFCLR
jgi:hypothetical protein